MTTLPDIKIGSELSNDELVVNFKCGNQGGMRKSNTYNSLILISDPFKGIYRDRWENNILFYTGMGKEGNQKFDRSNLDLADSPLTNLNLQLFEVFIPRKYYYHGPVRLVQAPFEEDQSDINGNQRKVIIFPLEVLKHTVEVELAYLKDRENLTDEIISKKSSSEIAELINKNKKADLGKRKVSTSFYERNPLVKEYVKRRSNSKCELCRNEAPFASVNGAPFLEVHHIKWLSNNGEDTIENAVALCPNCHRKMHILNLESDIEILMKLPKYIPNGG